MFIGSAAFTSVPDKRVQLVRGAETFERDVVFRSTLARVQAARSTIASFRVYFNPPPVHC